MTKIPTRFRTHFRHSTLFTSISLIIALSPPLMAQQDSDDIEEIVVTGSYIRNSIFAGASPVDTIDQDTLLNYGSANIGQYIRDLTYTQNVDTVANVLGGAGGGQDSNSAQFNLRGLGTSSTLTLFDGRRNVNPGAISAILPDIATDRIEVVLDGGSALYGSDAVAGVVNIIPIKEYDGFRVRSFYSRDEKGDFEEPKLSVLFGKRFENINVDFVAALEVGKKTPLQRGEREKYLRVDNATFIGAPGHYQLADGTPYLDPDCGTYNGDNTDKGVDGSFPSGFPIANGLLCGFHYAQWTDYNREASDYNFYTNAKHEVSDKLTLEFQSTISYRESIFHTEPVTPLATAWYDRFIVPANHPANPTGQAVRPGVFGIGTFTIWNGLEEGVGTKPSYLNGSSYQEDRYQYTTTTSKVGATYDIGDTGWVGETWISYQEAETRVDTEDGNVLRLEAALNGRGGPSGTEWFNPFNSRDVRSAAYDADPSDGTWTNNSQDVVDWLFESGDVTFSQTRLRLIDSFVTGDVMELPAGTMSAAFGLALRDTRSISRSPPLQTAGIDFSSSAGATAPLGEDTSADSMVRSIFGELEIPILDNLSMQIAARYEEFTDLDLETTTPKIALRWQPLDSLSLRASWGESFLAPTAAQVGPVERTNCVNARTGVDRLTGAGLLGVLSCTSKSPTVQPEESEIWNIGFTWEGIEGLSISLDYQEIEYVDRIVTLISQDVTNQEFFSTLNALGISPDDYDPTPGSATREAALGYIAANPRATVTRDASGNLLEVLRIPDNINSNNVEVFDFQTRYAFEIGDWGNFNVALNTAYYRTYEYAGFDGSIVDALGRRNADTALSPPLPKVVTNFRLNWNRGQHAASMLTKYTHGVTFDGSSTTGVTPPRAIDASYIVNANYTYFFENLFGNSGSMTIGSNNLFDWEPRRLPVTGGFESRLYDNFGRMFFASLDIEL